MANRPPAWGLAWLALFGGAGWLLWRNRRQAVASRLPATPAGPTLDVRYAGTVSVPYNVMEGLVKEAIRRYL